MIFTESMLYLKLGNVTLETKCIKKFRNHCYETGSYRRPACNDWKFRYKPLNLKPDVFHNDFAYDFNLIFSGMTSKQ